MVRQYMVLHIPFVLTDLSPPPDMLTHIVQLDPPLDQLPSYGDVCDRDRAGHGRMPLMFYAPTRTGVVAVQDRTAAQRGASSRLAREAEHSLQPQCQSALCVIQVAIEPGQPQRRPCKDRQQRVASLVALRLGVCAILCLARP